MRDYFSPRDGFWLCPRFGSASFTFQFNLFHRRAWFGTGSRPSMSTSFFICRLSLLSRLLFCVWCNSFLYNTIFSFRLLATVDLKVLNEIDLNMCLRCCTLHCWNTLSSRIAINPRQFILWHDINRGYLCLCYEVCHTKLVINLYFLAHLENIFESSIVWECIFCETGRIMNDCIDDSLCKS